MCGVCSTDQNQPEIADVMLVEGIWQVNSLSEEDYKNEHLRFWRHASLN